MSTRSIDPAGPTADNGKTGGPAHSPPPPRYPSTVRWFASDIAWILLLAAIVLITRILWRYRGGVGESDVMVMAAGLARGLAAGTDWSGTMLYGRQFSPGIYLLFRAARGLLGPDPAHTLGFLNVLGLAAGSLLAWPLFLLFRRAFRPAVAAGCTLLTLFSPLVWETTIYFHPVVPAVLLLLLACLAFERIAWSASGAAFGALTLLLAFAATLMRAEVALAGPAIFLAAVLSGRRIRNVLAVGGIGLVVAVAYVLFIRATSTVDASPAGGLSDYMRRYLELYVRLNVIPRSIAWTMLGAGAGSVLLALVGLGMLWLRPTAPKRDSEARWRGTLAVAILWILVPLLFWLPNPVPRMRHYFLVVPGVVWILGETVLHRLSGRILLRVIAILIAFNLAVPEVLYHTYNRIRPAAAKGAHGSFFSTRDQTVRQIDAMHALQARVEAALEDGERVKVAIQVSWVEYAYLLYWIAENPGRFHELEAERVGQEVTLYRFDAAGASLCLLLSGPLHWTSTRNLVLSQIARLLEDGYTVFCSEELARERAPGDPRIGAALVYGGTR